MLSKKPTKLFVNINSFAALLVSWWAIGMFASRKAVQNDGRYFESSFLNGLYYNDWLPVIAAVALGSGWGVSMLVITLNRSNPPRFSLRMLFLIFVSPVLCLLIYFGFNTINRSLANDLLEPSLLLFLFGILFGSSFAQLRNIEMDMND